MLEDIEDGELDYDEDGQLGDGIEDLPDLPEYDPGTKKEDGEDGEIVSDNDEEREDGEIRDEDEVGLYFCFFVFLYLFLYFYCCYLYDGWKHYCQKVIINRNK